MRKKILRQIAVQEFEFSSNGPMVRYVPIEETVILILCSVFVNHMKRIRNTNDRLVDVIVFYRKK